MFNWKGFISQLNRFYDVLWCHYSEWCHNTWNEVLSQVDIEFNFTVHMAYRKTLFSIVYGFKPVLPLDNKTGMEYKVHTITEMVQAPHNIQQKVFDSFYATNESIA